MLPHVQKDPAQLGIPNCSKAHYEVTIGKRNSQLGILKCSKTHYKVTIGNPNSQLGIDKCSETHYEVTIGNFNSQLGIPKCSETHHEVTIGNFNSQLGTPKCSKTRYEMTIGNLTPFGELNLYKRNGVGRPPSDRLPGCICWQISIVNAKASTWGDTPSPVRCKFGNRACANTSTPVRITLCSSCILCNSGTATVAFLPVSSLLIAVPEFPGCWLRMATLEASRGPWSSAVL